MAISYPSLFLSLSIFFSISYISSYVLSYSNRCILCLLLSEKNRWDQIFRDFCLCIISTLTKTQTHTHTFTHISYRLFSSSSSSSSSSCFHNNFTYTDDSNDDVDDDDDFDDYNDDDDDEYFFLWCWWRWWWWSLFDVPSIETLTRHIYCVFVCACISTTIIKKLKIKSNQILFVVNSQEVNYWIFMCDHCEKKKNLSN